MRRPLLLACFVLMAVSPSFAECRYFRTTYKLLKCVEWKDPETAPSAADPIEGAEFQDGITVKVTCSCDYSLSGSDPLCEFDQTQEQASIRGVENVRSFCIRGKELCNDVCARHLP